MAWQNVTSNQMAVVNDCEDIIFIYYLFENVPAELLLV